MGARGTMETNNGKWEQEEQWRQTILATRYALGFARHIKKVDVSNIEKVILRTYYYY